MSKLAIYQHGDLIETLELKPGTDYYVGRGKDCDYVLDGATGISRQHLKIYHNGSHWTVEVLSKFGNVMHKGARIEELELEGGETFSTKSFEFHFQTDASSNNQVPAAVDPMAAPQDMPPQTPGSNLPQTLHHQLPDLTDNTSVGRASGKPYIKINNRTTDSSETLRLEGHVWIAGRDANCEIVLKERGASRHHFELSHAQDGYYIRDLNSANGTQINGTKILADQPHPIQSGDVIDVLSLSIHFQIRDPNYDNMLEQVPAAMMEPIAQPLGGWGSLPMTAEEGHPPATDGEADETDKKKFDFKKNRVKLATAVILLLALYVGLSDGDQQKKRMPAEEGLPEIYVNLPKEQQEMIKNSYEVAKEQQLRKKCELAIPELKRIHELVPFYKNSKDIEVECLHYIDIIRQQEEIAEKRRQARELRAQVDAIAQECASKMTDTTTIDELNNCLGEAPSLMPDHVGIQQLRATIEERELERERKAQEAAAWRRRVRQGERLYQAAITLEQQGRDYEAVQAFNKFLNAKKPDPNGLKPQAESKIASLESSMTSKISAVIEQARTYFEQTQFQKGMYLLNKGLKINPNSSEIKEEARKWKKQNDREMKLIYDDSILEESLGNIESAKDKWRRILELSYSGSSYYKKAKIKLSRYGAS